jgi:hypothetical protein
MSDQRVVDVTYLQLLSDDLQRSAGELRAQVARFHGDELKGSAYGNLGAAHTAEQSYRTTHGAVVEHLHRTASALEDNASRLAEQAAIYLRADLTATELAEELRRSL